MNVSYYRQLLLPIVRDHTWVIFGGTLASAAARVHQLRELGAGRCLVIAFGWGTGSTPAAEDADWLVVEQTAVDIVDAFRQQEQAMVHPTDAVVEALDTFDPTGRAWVLGPPGTLSAPPERVAGRHLHGGRQSASLQFEDKVAVDGFWDALGIRRAPARVVPASLEPLQNAFDELDAGMGTVFAGDATSGLHGGGTLVRWVCDRASTEQALAFLAPRCRQLRVTPFLEGIPCSIHGIVFRDHVLAGRPVEMITLRTGEGLRYCGAATFWDPPPEDARYMRRLARRVGKELRRRIAFRGPFTVDGVMTSDGFLPTELNSRFGAGLNVLAQSLPDLPLTFIAQTVLAGEDLDWRPRELERLLVKAADARRSGGAWTAVNLGRAETERFSLRRGEDGWRWSTPGEPADGRLEIGPSALGGFLRFTPDPARRPAGSSLAPDAAQVLMLADGRFGAGLGRLQAAREMRHAGQRVPSEGRSNQSPSHT